MNKKIKEDKGTEYDSEFTNDLQIDALALDQEWLMQSSKFKRWADLSAEYKKQVKELKANLRIIEAKTYKFLRQEADGNNEKVTEKILEHGIVLDKKYQKASAELRKAEFISDVLQSGVESMRQRKDALQELVVLLLNGYYSEPVQRVSDTGGRKLDVTEKASETQIKKLKKRKKVKK